MRDLNKPPEYCRQTENMTSSAAIPNALYIRAILASPAFLARAFLVSTYFSFVSMQLKRLYFTIFYKLLILLAKALEYSRLKYRRSTSIFFLVSKYQKLGV